MLRQKCGMVYASVADMDAAAAAEQKQTASKEAAAEAAAQALLHVGNTPHSACPVGLCCRCYTLWRPPQCAQATTALFFDWWQMSRQRLMCRRSRAQWARQRPAAQAKRHSDQKPKRQNVPGRSRGWRRRKQPPLPLQLQPSHVRLTHLLEAAGSALRHGRRDDERLCLRVYS